MIRKLIGLPLIPLSHTQRPINNRHNSTQTRPTVGRQKEEGECPRVRVKGQVTYTSKPVEIRRPPPSEPTQFIVPGPCVSTRELSSPRQCSHTVIQGHTCLHKGHSRRCRPGWMRRSYTNPGTSVNKTGQERVRFQFVVF